MSTLLVENATVLDGSGGEPVRADVLVDERGVIAAVGPTVARAAGEVGERVDGTGQVLAPGFVDLHSHSDLYTLVSESPGGAPVGDAPKLVQGCTAQVFGQDGISAAPFAEHDLGGHLAFVAGLDGSIPAAEVTWRSFGEYRAAVRARSSTRAALLVGHSTLRRLVMGDSAREARDEEIAGMRQALAVAFDQGASGLSTGLVYAPAAYATTDEVAALCEVAAAYGRPFFVHVRSESERVLEATDEVISVAERTGCHLHYSHIKVAGRENWHKASEVVRRVDAAREAGVAITADVHPYVAGATTAVVLLPPWVQDGGQAAAIARLADPSVRARLRRQLLEDTSTWDNWWRFSDGWRGLRVAGASRRELVGRSFAEVIRGAGVSDLRSQEAFDVVFSLLASERLAMSLISFNNVEENVAMFMSRPYTSIGTDAVVDRGGHPHPRLYGTFPRVLGHFVRELGALSLPEAVAKMTSRAAAIVGLGGRIGELRPGLAGDMVLFDPDEVIDRATFEAPFEPPAGVSAVWVGGRRVAGGGAVTEGAGRPAGEPLPGSVAGPSAGRAG